MDRIKDGGPAFPSGSVDICDGDAQAYAPGMSLRDWFAVQALIALGDRNPNLPGSPASTSSWPLPDELAKRKAQWAYFQADAMLAAREADQ